MIKNLIRYFKGIYFIKAFLVALAMVIAVIVSVYFFDSFDVGFSVALGAILCAPSDVSGSVKHKFYGMLASIILAFSITFLIGYFNNYLPVLVPLLIILVFLISYISVFGFRASLISLSGLIALVLAFGHQSTEISIFEHSLFIVLGGVWYLILAISTQLLLPRVQADYLFVELLEKTAEFIKIRGKLLAEENDRTSLLEENFKLQTAINELQENIREVVLEKDSIPGLVIEQDVSN
ncbi:hypothetical protein OEG92_04145 [Polaribacter sejongensis]|uniref:FUSC family membrane protein n=1 Tax=Polaribacter sejongensis TaxID=985043 RepID=UPI0035A633B6